MPKRSFRQCDGKQAYETLDKAWAAKRFMPYYNEVRPYKCKVCKKFHLGHRPKRRR